MFFSRISNKEHSGREVVITAMEGAVWANTIYLQLSLFTKIGQKRRERKGDGKAGEMVLLHQNMKTRWLFHS